MINTQDCCLVTVISDLSKSKLLETGILRPFIYIALIANGLTVRIGALYVWCSAVGVCCDDQSSHFSINSNIPLGYNCVVVSLYLSS